MAVHHICPRCRLTVAEERLHILPFVCDNCGYSKSESQNDHEKSDSKMMMTIAGGIVLTFVVLASSVELRFLQARDFVGLSSIKSLERLQQICTQLAKPDCIEHSLAKQAKFEPKRTARYTDYLITRQKFKQAVASMRPHIASGKADVNAYMSYGRALAENKQMDEAAKYFERAISMPKPSIDHIHTYVKYLTRAKRYDQALAVILKIRRTHLNALPVEYRVISEMRSSANNRFVAGKR